MLRCRSGTGLVRGSASSMQSREPRDISIENDIGARVNNSVTSRCQAETLMYEQAIVWLLLEYESL